MLSYIICMSLNLLMNLVEVAIKIPTLMSTLRVRGHGRVSKDDCSDSFPPCVHMQHAALPIKRWSLFPLHLKLDWLCDLLGQKRTW